MIRRIKRKKDFIVCRSAGFVATLLAALFLLAGCDNTIDPIVRDKGLYSVYGILDMTRQENYIRVKDLNSPFTADATRDLDATVTLANSATGETEELVDVPKEVEGIFIHNFRTTLSIQSGTRYLLTIERSDGKQMTAWATAPAPLDRRAQPTGQNCLEWVTVSYNDVKGLKFVRSEIGVEYRGKKLWIEDFHLNLRYFEEAGRITISFRPVDVLIEISSPGANSPAFWCHELSSDRMYVRYTHFGPDFYRQTFSHPLDIPGGSGQFGALNKGSFSFPIDTTNVNR